MGVIFKWFKNYRIYDQGSSSSTWYGGYSSLYKVEYLDSGATSHSYGNRTNLQNLFNQIVGKEIPTEPYTDFYNDPSEWYARHLIRPKVMAANCDKVLQHLEENEDENDLKDRVKWIKKLSEQGYYVMYDNF